MSNNPRIFLISGELSGDQRAAELIQKVKSRRSDLIFYGIAGDNAQAAGMQINQHIKSLSVIGITELITKIPKIIRLYKKIKQILSQTKPNLIILIDYPGLNLKIAQLAHKYKIPVLYYIPPKIWASRPKRIKTMQRCVDHVATIFPFEMNIYQKANIPVTGIRNPLLDSVQTKLSVQKAKSHFHLEKNKITIGIMPGSRDNEVKRLLPLLLDTAQKLHKNQPNIQFILPLASHISPQYIQKQLYNYPTLPINIVTENHYDAINLCNLVLITSGTATLETALLKVPMVIVYKLSWTTYLIAKLLIKTPYIGLPNILMQKYIVPELIQHQANSTQLYKHAIDILNNKNQQESIKNAFAELRKSLSINTNTCISECILTLLEKTQLNLATEKAQE